MQDAFKSNGYLFCTLFLMIASMVGCADTETPSTRKIESEDADNKIALISITSDPAVDPQSVNMGLTMAGFCVDEGYDVAIFFNVKGVKLPTKAFDSGFKYLEHQPMLAQVKDLRSRGVELHVCPVCMGDLKIENGQIIDEAFVTSKPQLFTKLGGDTIVFTY